MTALDYGIFAAYMVGVLAVGVWFWRRNESAEDYYVGGRSIGATHVGLSVVATDVGGGFSIGLGGLGFTIGLAGSWMLFTGLLGAWLSAVFIIPRIKALDRAHGMMTYPDFLRHRYGAGVALVAAVISAAGYTGFASGQILAGAKLAAGTVLTDAQVPGLEPLQLAILSIGAVMVTYTVLGGLKAVIYTDTAQWIILLVGLTFLAIPFALDAIGGLDALRAAVGPAHFDPGNVSAAQLLRWGVSILPIWLVAMTLYQRMFACRDVAEARKAWYIAGVFEWPIMAFLGVFLGICARALYPTLPLADAEMGLPMLIRDVLPIGVTGIVVASYFSAIMSTADSCLIASSGNIVGDIVGRHLHKGMSPDSQIRWSQGVTLTVGAVAIGLASGLEEVLDAILYAYEFLVAGLFVPTLGAYFWPRSGRRGAVAAMIGGGGTTLALLLGGVELPWWLPAGLAGILVSALLFVPISLLEDRA